MKRIITLFIIFLSIFIFGCTTEKKQNNTIPQSNIHTPSTLVVDPYSTSKFESLNFGDSLEKIKTLHTLIYYDEYPNSLIKSQKHKSYLFQTNANSYYNIPLIYDAPLLELSFLDNKLYKITARLDVKDENDGLEKFEIINKEHQKHMFSGILFLFRRWKQMIFCIVVDHCFCQNLIGLESALRSELCVHKGRDLVHI